MAYAIAPRETSSENAVAVNVAARRKTTPKIRAGPKTSPSGLTFGSGGPNQMYGNQITVTAANTGTNPRMYTANC